MNAYSTISRLALLTVAAALVSCAVQAPPPRVVYVTPPPSVAFVPEPPPPVVSVYIEPPLVQPVPIVIGWAPPPMLVDAPPPIPFEGAFWTGGYWAWHGQWVWSAGRWAPAPQVGYGWVNPYYESRSGVVIFIGGHWAAPGVVFVPPPPTLNLTVSVVLAGVVAGPRPIGPQGVFVPPPPGSRPGLIIPAPIGTPPAVVIGAPPVTNVGMRIQNRVENNTTTINNTRVTNITNVTNVTNVTIVAPASATASGRAFDAQVPNLAQLAAAQTPAVRATAPTPASIRPIAAFSPDRPMAPLPPAQSVQMRAASARPAPAAAPVSAAQPELSAMRPPPAPLSVKATQAEHPLALPERQRAAQANGASTAPLAATRANAAMPAQAASGPAQRAPRVQPDKATHPAKPLPETHRAEPGVTKEKPPKHNDHEGEHKSE